MLVNCDAAALDALNRKQKRLQELEQERQDIAEEELDHLLAQYVAQQQK